ncbi:kirola [Lactuca sativa]|nr:kirola [Lactuca sativa]
MELKSFSSLSLYDSFLRAMALSGILVKKIPIKSDGNVFYDILTYSPYNVCEICPDCMNGVDLEDGEWGVIGCVIVVSFIHDGKTHVVKEVLQTIDKEKKSVSYNVIGGDIMDAFKTFLITVDVDTSEEESFVTLTFQYEKLDENLDAAESLMDFCVKVIADMENYYLAKSI